MFVEEVAKVMEEMIYVRETKDDKPFAKTDDLSYVNPILKGFRLMYWPNDLWNDNKAAFWLERRGEDYGWEHVIEVECKAFKSCEDMACMIISAVTFCEKIGS